MAVKPTNIEFKEVQQSNQETRFAEGKRSNRDGGPEALGGAWRSSRPGPFLRARRGRGSGSRGGVTGRTRRPFLNPGRKRVIIHKKRLIRFGRPRRPALATCLQGCG
jgi:hypothetical protein